MGYSRLVHLITNGLIGNDEALDRLEEMKRDYIINNSQFIDAKSLLSF